MNRATDAAGAMTSEKCRAYLEDRTFRLRPHTYGKKYPKWPGAVGIEIEMLPVFTTRNGVSLAQPEIVPLQGKQGTLAAWLRDLAQQKGWECVSDIKHNSDDLLLVRMDAEDNLSFEPGGQLEFSSKPYPCLIEAAARTREVQAILDGHLQEHGVELFQIGFNPWHATAAIGLQMAKPRYRAMNEYFARIGPFGQQMMRQTCTVQVNLDFGPDEATMARRYLASHLIAPIAAGMFSYSAIAEGKSIGITGQRSRVWRNIDNTRTGVLPNRHLHAIAQKLDKASCVDAYFEFAMQAQVVFVTDLGYRVPTPARTWQEWLSQPIDGAVPRESDFETHLSLLFSEVRPRGFLELRSVDCQSRVWELVPAAFYTGLLYAPKALDRVLDFLMPIADDLPKLLAASERGLHDPTLARLAKKVTEIAMEGLASHTCCYKGEGLESVLRHYYEHLTSRGRVPGDDLVAILQRDGGVLTAEMIQRAEAAWRHLL